MLQIIVAVMAFVDVVAVATGTGIRTVPGLVVIILTVLFPVFWMTSAMSRSLLLRLGCTFEYRLLALVSLVQFAARLTEISHLYEREAVYVEVGVGT